MSIRFQADADLNQIIVAAVVRRLPQIDFKTATVARRWPASLDSMTQTCLLSQDAMGAFS